MISHFQALAQISGDVIRPYFQQNVAVIAKSDDSPVTIADREAELAMRAYIETNFPEHGIIGEEFGNKNEDAEWVWTLDPIDGTFSFISGIPLFTTLVGLLHHGVPVWGMIYQPILNELVIGNGTETTLNGKKVKMRTCNRLQDAFMVATCTKNIEKYQQQSLYLALEKEVKWFRTWGDGYGYLILATGKADIMLDPIVNPWDIAPMKPIIEGAGGKISDWQGNSVVNAVSCIASAPNLHQEVVEKLNEL